MSQEVLSSTQGDIAMNHIAIFSRSIILIGLGILLFLLACGPANEGQSPEDQSIPQNAISSAQAASHVGERATVCGPVVDSRYATGSKGQPTFLNFDRAYNNHTFVVVIWESDRSKFPSNPERHYKGQDVCATGLIESYQGKPEIIVRDPSNLQIQR
jgi:DNA/RNA endonuclease YhcR with UshA esterase domain